MEQKQHSPGRQQLKGTGKGKRQILFLRSKEDGTSARIKNKWKNVKDAKTKKTYRYYFGKDGAAYAGSKDMFGRKKLAVKKIGGKQYGFDTNARMIKGVAASYLNSGKSSMLLILRQVCTMCRRQRRSVRPMGMKRKLHR